MSVHYRGRSYRSSFQSCGGSVLLGLELADEERGEPRVVSLGLLVPGPEPEVDPGAVRRAVVQALEHHRVKTGLVVPLVKIEYVPNDAPQYDKHHMLALRILHEVAPSAEALDSVQREAAVQRLGDEMSDLYERAYCGSWMCSTPTIVGLCRKAILTGQPQGWANTELTVEQAREMWRLAERVGGWADTDPDPDPARRHHYIVGYPFTALDSEGLEGEDIPWHS